VKSLLYYILQVIICSGILYGYYHIALRNKKFHLYNRYYLLAAAILSIAVPFLNIPVYFSSTHELSPAIQTLKVIFLRNIDEPNGITSPVITGTGILTGEIIFKLFYLLLSGFIFTRFLIGLFYIRRLLRKYISERIDRIYFINTEEAGTPFSFIKWMFWNKKINLQSEKGEQIFKHELFHIRQRHSWDIIFMELLLAVFWINPFFYFIKKEVRAIHEFLADEFAANENDKWGYAELLLLQVLESPHNHLINSFFHNHIKRRIAMITSSKNPGYQFFRKVMILPVITLVFLLFAFKIKNHSEKVIAKSDKRIAAGLDAGNSIKPAAFENYASKTDTSKPKMEKQKLKEDKLKKDVEIKESDAETEQKEFKNLMEEKQREAEKAQEEFKQMMMMKQKETQQMQTDFKKMLEARQREAQMEGQEKFKQLMEEQQHEAEKAQKEFKQMMGMKQQEAENAQAEFKKMLETRQREAQMEGREKFKQLMEEKQQEAEKAQEEFKKIMMMKQHEAENTQAEFKELMEKRQREMEMATEEFKKRMLIKQQEGERDRKNIEKKQ